MGIARGCSSIFLLGRLGLNARPKEHEDTPRPLMPISQIGRSARRRFFRFVNRANIDRRRAGPEIDIRRKRNQFDWLGCTRTFKRDGSRVPSLAVSGRMLAVVLLTDSTQFAVTDWAVIALLMISVLVAACLYMLLADQKLVRSQRGKETIDQF